MTVRIHEYSGVSKGKILIGFKKEENMSHIITLAIIFAVYYFYHVYKASVEEKEAEEDRFFEELKNSGKDEDMETDAMECLDERTITGLVLSTLRKIGCDYEMEQQGNINYIRFIFQGEHFTIDCNDDNYYINIYDTWWYEISIYSDIEEIADLHKVINIVNRQANCTLLYTVNEETELIGVHSKKNMLFISQIPELDLYLKSAFSEFFKVQRSVLTELEKCKVTENK